MADFGNNPAVHIFTDTEAALVRMRGTAEAAGCRIVSALPVAADGDLWTGAVPGAAILIELEQETAGERVIPLLDWFRLEAARGARRGVISAPVGLIDLIDARAAHAGIEHLCEASEEERLSAIARVARPTEPRLHDAGPEPSRLLQPSPDYAADSAGPADVPFIRTMIRARRLRGDYLPAELYADPAWDILLDLMAARLEGRKVAVSSLCIAAAVPPTTALRWIAVLTERGLLRRVADPNDGRRINMELSGETARALGAYVRRAQRMTAEAV
jgi:hypothetical protein